MENASKALLIAGAILISILIIAIGMYIYSTSQGSIDNAMSAMTTQEIDAFNKEWANYEGRMTGSQVKSLIGKLIANVETYRDENVKIIDLACQTTSAAAQVNAVFNHNAADAAANETAFVTALNNAYTQVQAKHTYRVVIARATNGLIDGITVNYVPTDTAVRAGTGAAAAPAGGGAAGGGAAGGGAAGGGA